MKWTLETVNARLKAGKIGVTIRQRGDRLSLRATLPPKPNSGKQIWYQQDISLGIYGNPAGFQRAEAEAKLLGGRIASGEFSWSFYMDVDDAPQISLNTEEWIKRFEQDYFARRGRSPTTEETWKTDYVSSWKLLEQEELSPLNLIAAASQVKANTRKRKLVCEKLAALARFADVAVDLSPYMGSYRSSDASKRYIPSTEEIESTYSLLNRPDWQWIYGVLAVYGLRPHEAFFCEISPDPPYLLKVLRGKTGYREVYPYHLRWVEMWQLTKQQKKPLCNASTLKGYGGRVTQAFFLRDLPFTPYCLRHAYCIRLATEYKIPVPVAASWTGHDPAIFLRVYNRWISGDEKRRVFEESQKYFQ